jgi:methionine biosynthesis protein MetW
MIKLNDNRKYFFKKGSHTTRAEFPVIEEVVGQNKEIIDLGCGDGSLMQILAKNKNECQGVEVSESGVEVCKGKGLKVVQGRIDTRLPYKDKKFDIAVCNVTIHMTTYPEVLFEEMLRISKNQIITFPNFAFVLNRLHLMFLGIFPRWSLFGYKWYSTGHIHQLSIKDFEQFCKERNVKIVGRHHLFPKPIRNSLQKLPIIGLLLNRSANLLATMAIFETKS